MHLLEEHMVPWLRRWHIATGLMGEQGAESLHVHLHKLENRFSGVVNDLDHLQYVVATATVLGHGRRVLVYSGKEDFICNYVGGMDWANGTQWSGQVGVA